ncbi:hypothetical protein P167DRAFT_392094 [Morchella conica CCBAS932]|uniref:Uncharacterized protein n=1 Tax=Morchella conica CCBAS932 TaxID=1392247 RepID=A0A3N4KE11_9PEZI|nr:hypothetical protein P167DRAFT_392094 [Morchella conica CCBAS932]
MRDVMQRSGCVSVHKARHQPCLYIAVCLFVCYINARQTITSSPKVYHTTQTLSVGAPM